jgi:dolichol-phosphate mannosyltransferase
VLRNDSNQGVGGATLRGYRAALDHGAEIIVKIDSDGQMDPAILPRIINPIVEGIADYVKGNRFYNIDDVRGMPKARLFGNAGLSFLTKLSSGYWNIFDPTNGYTAIHHRALSLLPTDKIDPRFFFESDMLFRLNLIGAVVVDVPIRATYLGEQSNLQARREIIPFLFKNCRNLLKRIVYRYFLRDLNLGSLELILGVLLLCFGVAFGASQWLEAWLTGVPATAGTVMLAALPILLGVQMLLGFFSFDMMAVPKTPLQIVLGGDQRSSQSRAIST